MNKMRALKDIDEQDGQFAEGEEFLVNDERCRILILQGKAERLGVQTAPDVVAEAAQAPAAPAAASVQFTGAPRATSAA